MRRYSSLFWVGLAAFVAVACQPQIDVTQLRSYPEDQQAAPYPPSNEELRRDRPFVVVYPPQAAEGVSPYANENSVTFLKAMLEEAGDLQIFDEARLQQVRDTDEFRRFDVTQETDAVRLGEALKVKYMVMLQTEPPTFEHEENDWSAVVTMKLYQLSPTKLLSESTFPYQHSQFDEMRDNLQPQLQAVLPMRAFLLETFEKRNVGRLNVGSSQGIKEQDQFAVYRRVKATMVDGNTTTRTERYTEQVGTLEVFAVEENAAWVTLTPAEGQQILRGDAAFRVVKYRTDWFKGIHLGE